MKKIITKQIVKANDPIYLKMRCSRATNTVEIDVPMVFSYLFTTYGTIEPEVLREHELKVHEMVYEFMDPIISLYNEIEELGHLGHALKNAFSISQIVNYGLTIIKNTNDF